MEKLKVASAQFRAIDGDIEFNMKQAEKMIRKVMQEKDVDLMLFNEACLDNFGDNERMLAEYSDEKMKQVEQFWVDMAKMAGFAIIAGYLGKNERGERHNYCACFTEDGEIIGKFAKVHLYCQERESMVPGDEAVVFDFKGWKIAPLICADLGFPELSRIQAYQGAELFCVPSCWAYPDDDLWIMCNRLRAAENSAYLVSCNRYGEEKSRMNLGNSMAVNPRGEIIANLGVEQEGYFVANLYKSLVKEERETIHWLRWQRTNWYKELI